MGAGVDCQQHVVWVVVGPGVAIKVVGRNVLGFVQANRSEAYAPGATVSIDRRELVCAALVVEPDGGVTGIVTRKRTTEWFISSSLSLEMVIRMFCLPVLVLLCVAMYFSKWDLPNDEGTRAR